jgi:single-strand DNA-binding protein
MKLIIIGGVIASDAVYRYKEDGRTIHSAVLSAFIQTGTADKGVAREVIVTVYGKAAADLKDLPDAHVIIEGDIEMPKGKPMEINNARIYPGTMGLALNRVSIAGNVGGDPEIQHWESGNTSAKFSVAARRTKEITDWCNFEIWGKQAETVSKFVTKGSQVGVVGQLKIEEWTDKSTGELRTAFRFVGDRLTLLGKRVQATASTQAEQAGYDDNDF